MKHRTIPIAQSVARATLAVTITLLLLVTFIGSVRRGSAQDANEFTMTTESNDSGTGVIDVVQPCTKTAIGKATCTGAYACTNNRAFQYVGSANYICPNGADVAITSGSVVILAPWQFTNTAKEPTCCQGNVLATPPERRQVIVMG